MIKHMHLGFVGLSFLGFLLRGYWMMRDSALLQAKLTRILPHVNDTLLLISALVLAVQLGLKPGDHPWLMAKIIGLVVYIVLGVIALKPGRPIQIRIAAFSLAVVTFLFIVSAAFTKSAAGFFA